jgi:hypothetical protein
MIARARSKRSGNRFRLKKIRRDQTLPARHRLNLKRYRLEHDPISMGAAEHKHGPAYGKVERMFRRSGHHFVEKNRRKFKGEDA